MGPRGIVGAFALVFVLSSLLVPLPARAVAPTISNVTWTPWVPAHLEYFTIEADIASPGGPPQVFAPVCTVPTFICVLHEMTDPDRDGRYATPPIRAPEERFSGVYFNVTAVDPGGNLSFTERIYVQVAGPQKGLSATLMVGLATAGVGVAAALAFAYRWRARRRKSL